jgi:hypothetical protein
MVVSTAGRIHRCGGHSSATLTTADSFPSIAAGLLRGQRNISDESVTGSGCGVKRLDDFRRNAASGRDLVSISPGPVADGGTLLAIDRGAAAGTGAPGATPPTTADPPARVDPLLEFVPEFGRILCRKVDLVVHTIDGEFDGFVGGPVAVEIIDKRDSHLFSHEVSGPFCAMVNTISHNVPQDRSDLQQRLSWRSSVAVAANDREQNGFPN